MGVIQFIKDWVNFKAMVTPVILKVLFQVLFWLLNILGIIALIGMLVFGLLGAVAAGTQDITTAAITLVGSIAAVAFGALMLLIYNLVLRIYFEVMLLLFNMYDSLLAIERNTKKNGQKRPGAMSKMGMQQGSKK